MCSMCSFDDSLFFCILCSFVHFSRLIASNISVSRNQRNQRWLNRFIQCANVLTWFYSLSIRLKMCGCVCVCRFIFNSCTTFFFVLFLHSLWFGSVSTLPCLAIALPCHAIRCHVLSLVLFVWHVLREGNHCRGWNGLAIFLLTFHRQSRNKSIIGLAFNCVHVHSFGKYVQKIHKTTMYDFEHFAANHLKQKYWKDKLCGFKPLRIFEREMGLVFDSCIGSRTVYSKQIETH